MPEVVHMEYEKINENEIYTKDTLKSLYDSKKNTLSWKDYYGDTKSVSFVVLEPGKTITVGDYPYGFRLRTNIRYMVETTNMGSRFVSQTLNPKTNEWNAPKKSTYNPIALLVVNNEGHVTTLSLDHNDSKDKTDVYTQAFENMLNDKQKVVLSSIKKYQRMMENVKFEIVETSSSIING